MTTICISFPNTFFFKRLKKSLQFDFKGAVNYKSKLFQAMAWHREDTKPLPESVVIQANGAYMSLSDWLSWLFHVLGRYIHTEKNGTVWAHKGYLHPHSWKWAIPTHQVGSGRGTGWPYFLKSPMRQSSVHNAEHDLKVIMSPAYSTHHRLRTIRGNKIQPTQNPFEW